jgi:hypothetical protein
MDDPRTVIRQMKAPYTVSKIDLCRDGGAVIFNTADRAGMTIAGTLITPFRGTPRRLTLGTSYFEPPDLVRITRFALMYGGPTEALVHDILRHWRLTLDSARMPHEARHIETVLNELENRLGTIESDDLEELEEFKLRT